MAQEGRQWVSIGAVSSLDSSSRFTVRLRSDATSRYHSLVIYKLGDDGHAQRTATWYAMEEECPHLGASLSEATLEIEDDGVVAICPWHSYDFNLKTGESSTGLTTCVYHTRTQDGVLQVEPPTSADDWDLVSVRPVSERFAVSPASTDSAPSPPISDQPKTLTGWGALILSTPDPYLKVSLTRHAVSLFRLGSIPSIGSSTPPDEPPRQVKIVAANLLGGRGKGGSVQNRIKLLHALANIEQWAIDLAWDIMVRFANAAPGSGPEGKRRLPLPFFSDFCKVAEDEAKHFTLLREALQRLGSDWGALPIHNGLWQSARDTSHSLVSRLCIIHLVHEARGLDVNPTQIKRVRAAGDDETAASLEIIHADEITHVAAGHRWLLHCCETSVPAQDPVATFRREVKQHFYGKLKPPFNSDDRAKAGLQPRFYEGL